MTVIGIQEKKKNCGSYQGSGNNVYFNHWNSVIGGTDSNDHSMGMYFNGGTVYAASAPLDNCTAIGGGGNGTGEVTINGGRVTAVAYTTGTAIGGGIAHTGVGGIGIVQINGGKVYAYNYGQPAYQTVSNFGSANAEQKWAASHVAGTAIGGASSIIQSGSQGTVTVTGGTVYAESLGGSGLGGGNSVSANGGAAVIKISGGSVTAKSTKQDNYAVVSGRDYHVAAGAAIGGGTGGIGGNGGNATINISQADPLVPTTVKTGSMGGGGTNNPSGKTGYASVTMSGGSLQGQIVMAKGGTKGCSFTMTGGTLSNTDFICLKADGGAVWMDDDKGEATIQSGEISGYSANWGGAVYMTAGTFNMQGGTIKSCLALQGGAVYMAEGTFNLSGGSIESCASTSDGGAVYMTAGEFNLSDEGRIESCVATANGGAIYLGKKSETEMGVFQMTGGQMLNNTATADGGAVYLNGGDANVTGGIVTGNGAQNGGGAALNGGFLTVGGTANFFKNTSQQNGGGAYLNGGSVEMSGGSFTQNEATLDGGAFFVNGGDVRLLAGSISGNRAQRNGGGVAIRNGDFEMHGGAVDSNHAIEGQGGGIYVTSLNVEVSVLVLSGSVSNNDSASNGGAIAVVGQKSQAQTLNVTVGVNETHVNNGGVPEADHCSCTDGHTQRTCPVLNNNSAYRSGGAIFITGGTQTKLNLYCLHEDGNVTPGEPLNESTFLKVEGGTVVISCSDSQVEGEIDDDHGSIVIKNNIHVTAGTMNIYGSMTNPRFDGVITVDIESDEHSYHDGRYNAADVDVKYYKLQYFENFGETVGNAVGQYKAIQLTEEQLMEHVIQGFIYANGGYMIEHWMTPNGDFEYIVGETIADMVELYNQGGKIPGIDYDNPDEMERYTLRIYAMWRANGYNIQFEANIYPHKGSMDILECTYDQDYVLPQSGFSSVGKIFTGWNTQADGLGTAYAVGQSVRNLTLVQNATFVLYAQWIDCPHEGTFTFVATGAKLTRTCTCLGLTDSVELQASSVSYDGDPHPVFLHYVGDRSYAEWGELVLLYNGFAEEPVNAGVYTATFGIAGSTETAELTYQIFKANQPIPAQKPEYTPDVVVDVLVIHDSIPISTKGTKPEYQVRYYEAGELKVYEDPITGAEWLQMDGAELEVKMTTAWTSYHVIVRYEGNENYLPSGEVMADSAYYFDPELGDKIIIRVSVDSGISAPTEIKADGQVILDPIVVLGDYFALGGKTTVTVVKKYVDLGTTVDIPDTLISHTQRIDGSERWVLSGIAVEAEKYEIIIHVSGVCLKASSTLAIAPGERFDAFDTVSGATISADSAFTLRFAAENLDLSAYGSLKLKFDRVLPIGTVIVLMRQEADGTRVYWYNVLTVASDSVTLDNSFLRMGHPEESLSVEGGTVAYQAVVDFSYVQNGSVLPNGTVLGCELTTSQNGANFASPAKRSVQLVRLTPSVSEGQGNGQTLVNTMEVEHNQDGAAVATKWESRRVMIVLVPQNPELLPPDTVLLVSVGNNTDAYRWVSSADRRFVIDVGEFGSLDESISFSMESEMFPQELCRYVFDVQCHVTNSSYGTTSGGEALPYEGTLTFVKAARTEVELQLILDEAYDGRKIFETGERIAFTVEYGNLPEGATVYAVLERKNDNNVYESTGRKETVDETSGALVVSLAGQVFGSYRVNVIVESEDGRQQLASVQYYIVVVASLP